MRSLPGSRRRLDRWRETDRRLSARARREASKVEHPVPSLPAPSLPRLSGRRPRRPRPPASVVIPTALVRGPVDGAERVYLEPLLASLLPTLGALDSVVIVLDPSAPRETVAGVTERWRRPPRVRFVQAEGPFSFPDRVNLGVASSCGGVVVLLNDDMEVISPDWLDRMTTVAAAPGVGAVGATLLFEDGRIQHAGVTTIDYLPTHAYTGRRPDDLVDDGVLCTDRPVWAVTGACLAVSMRHWRRVGGFSHDLPVNYNDIDFCLKLSEEGLVNVVLGGVQLRHFESRSRGRELETSEVHTFQERWLHRLGVDPLTQGSGAYGGWTEESGDPTSGRG